MRTRSAALALSLVVACAPDGRGDDAGAGEDAGAGVDGGTPAVDDDAGPPIDDDAGFAPVGDAGNAPADCAAVGAGFAPTTSALRIAAVTAQYDATQDERCAPAEDAVVVNLTMSGQDFDPDHVAWAFDAAHAPRDAIVSFRFGNGVSAVACATGGALALEVAVQLVLDDGTATSPACADVAP